MWKNLGGSLRGTGNICYENGKYVWIRAKLEGKDWGVEEVPDDSSPYRRMISKGEEGCWTIAIAGIENRSGWRKRGCIESGIKMSTGLLRKEREEEGWRKTFAAGGPVTINVCPRHCCASLGVTLDVTTIFKKCLGPLIELGGREGERKERKEGESKEKEVSTRRESQKKKT